jgi:uncharacterized membrane protein HdeD (DUF308 family)
MEDLIFCMSGIALLVLAILALSRRHTITGVVLLLLGVASEIAGVYVSVKAVSGHLTIVDLCIFLTMVPIALLVWYFYKHNRPKPFGAGLIALGLVGLYASHLHAAYYSTANTVISAMIDVFIIVYGLRTLIAKPKSSTTADPKAK